MSPKPSPRQRLKRVLVYILSLFAILAILLPVIQIGFAVSSSPFLGEWQAADANGDEIRLVFKRPPEGPLQITWTGGEAAACESGAGLVRGTGRPNASNPYMLESDLQLECFTGEAAGDFHITWRYHPVTKTLSGRSDEGEETTWHRPEGPTAAIPALKLRVDYGMDRVESFYEAGHKSSITLTESDGMTVKGTAGLMTGPREYWDAAARSQDLEPVWSDAHGRRMEDPPDIQPGDWVFGWVDNGASAQVQVGEIRASADLETGSVGGMVLAPWITAPVAVACQDWGREAGDLAYAEGGSIAADGAQTFSCAWKDGDFQDGRSIAAGYMSPDGSWVTNTFFTGIPTFKAYVPAAIEGYDWPLGSTVTLSIDGEYSARAVSRQRPGAPVGRTRVLFELGREDFSLEPGNHILMTDGSTTKEGVVTALAVTDFDLTRRAVSGVYDPGSSLQVWIYDEEGEVAKADPKAGTWMATFDKLRAGALGGASQQDADGDATSIEFEVPQIFSISSTEDVSANDGVCSLREAIMAANTNEASGSRSDECPPGLDSQVDIIELRAGQVYALTIDRRTDNAADGDLDIVDNPAPVDLIIRAEGNGRATISQDAALVDDRVLENHEATVWLENLVLTGGGNVGSGGGLLNNGTLEMTGSIVSGNSVGWDGGGIHNSDIATLSIDSSSIVDNSSASFAGGIMNRGTLMLRHSEVRGNTSVHAGGGIDNEGTLTVEASVLSANASNQGGALYNPGTASVGDGTLVGGPLPEDANSADGGGGLLNLGTLALSDSTITGNHAKYGGGLFNWTGGRLTVSNSRVLDNHAKQGGGLHNKEQATALIQEGTIFSGNYAEWSGGGMDNQGALTITDSVLRENMSPGEAGDAVSGGFRGSSTDIRLSCIAGNGDTAIFSNQVPTIYASGNWWGSRSGPAHRSNPGGAGDSVSDFVNFSEWLTEPPAICAP